MNNVKAIQKLNETELNLGVKSASKSWHDMYSSSAYIFIGGLDYGLTEGDILSIFSQYGEIVNINLVRDKKTGKSKGYCFLAYEDQRSTILAVDNFNGIKLCGRTIRVDHVAEYRRPKDEDGKEIIEKGCAPKTPTPSPSPPPEDSQRHKKSKKHKEKKRRTHEHRQSSSVKTRMIEKQCAAGQDRLETRDDSDKKCQSFKSRSRTDRSSDYESHSTSRKRHRSTSKSGDREVKTKKRTQTSFLE